MYPIETLKIINMEESSMSNTFFIADTHFGHANILAFDNRPFTDINIHDETLIENWNNKISIHDECWILGDISWHNATKTNIILSKLNGIKHLIIGNHDHKLLRNRDFQSQFQSIQDYKELRIPSMSGPGSETLVLSHYPNPCFNSHYYGAYHFYGHVHNSYEWAMMEHLKRQSEELYDKPCNMINIGAMLPYINYKPLTFEEIVDNYNTYLLEKNNDIRKSSRDT